MTPPASWFIRLRDVDLVFISLLKGMMDPESIPAAFLAYRSHSAFRAAAGLALAGQCSESFMVSRGCLEAALYANHLSLHSHSWDIWRNRGDSPEARKACQREFTGRAILESADSRDAVLGNRIRGLYERTIDLGAHPNELAVGSSYEISESPEAMILTSSYVSGDPLSLVLAQKSATQAGVMVLDLLCHVFPKRSLSQRIQEQLLPLKRDI